MAKKRLFISFDYDHDSDIKMLLANQQFHPDSPFEFTDASVKEHLTGDWKDKVRGRIQRADVIAVLCGKHTHTAAGINAELQMAQELGKPYFLLQAYKDGGCTKPLNANHDDPIYTWTWQNLKALVMGER